MGGTQHARGLTVEDTLDLIKSVDRRTQSPNGEAFSARFHLYDYSYIKRSAALRQLTTQLHKLSAPLTRSQLLRSLLKGTVRELELRADYVVVRNNIRLFYLGGNQTRAVKLYTRSDAARRSLAAEVAARKRVEDVGGLCFRTPEVYTVAAGETPPYLIEEHIVGRAATFRRDQHLLLNIVDSMFRIYGCTCLEYRPYEAVIGKAREQAIYNGLAVLELKTALTPVLARFFAAASRCLIPVSFAHRDFALGNIMITPDGPVVIDWELAGAGYPVVFDLWRPLRKLPNSQQGFRDAYLARIEANMQVLPKLPSEIMPARFQAALYELRRVAVGRSALRIGKKELAAVKRNTTRALRNAAELVPEHLGELKNTITGA